MTRVDFYLAEDPLSATVRLCDKASSSGLGVYVYCPNPAQLQALDDLLWTQRQGSFISHERYEGREPSPPLPKVLLGGLPPPATWQQVLVNLSPELPAFIGQFERLLELVGPDEASRSACRQRYKQYRDAGHPLATYEQTAEGGWRAKG